MNYQEMLCSVYLLLDPKTRAVRYVGVTVKTPEARLRQHLALARYRARHPRPIPRKETFATPSEFFPWLISLEKRGLLPVVEVAAVVAFADAGSAEALEINRQMLLGAKLLNKHHYRLARPYGIEPRRHFTPQRALVATR